MELKYTVSEKEYLDLLTSVLLKRRKSVGNILLFLVMTVGQVLVVVRCIHSLGVQGTSRWVLIALSAAICLIQVVYQLSCRQRALRQMRYNQKSGKISPDFWKKQLLTLKADVLTLKVGKQQLTYDCAYFERGELMDGMLILNMKRGRELHQILIPASAFESDAQREQFLSTLRDSKRDSILAGMRETLTEARPEDALYSVAFSYSRKAFVRDCVKSARMAYGTKAAWSFTVLAKLAGAAFLLYHLFAGNFSSLSFQVFAVLISFILCYQHILTWTPLAILLARRSADVFFCGLEELEAALDITEKELVYSGDTFFNRVSLSQVRAAASNDRLLAVYLKDGTSITVPIDESNWTAATRCALFLEGL